jgi:hypothetical protein
MNNLIVGIAIAAIVGIIAVAARRRRVADVPTQRTFSVPAQIDRTDFGSPSEDWLVAVFTSATCPVCADVAGKVRALASRHVATCVADFASDRDLHERYRIDGVPLVVIADAHGVVRHHILGPVSATDLWAAVAAVRDGTDPASRNCSGH